MPPVAHLCAACRPLVHGRELGNRIPKILGFPTTGFYFPFQAVLKAVKPRLGFQILASFFY